ncbi:ornithine decarboxylase, partial [Caerostris extrusa]
RQLPLYVQDPVKISYAQSTQKTTIQDWRVDQTHGILQHKLTGKVMMDIQCSIVNSRCPVDGRNRNRCSYQSGSSPSRIVYANCYKGSLSSSTCCQIGSGLHGFRQQEELVKIKLLYPCAQLLLRIKIVASSAFVPMSCKFGCDLDKASDLLRFAHSLDLTVIGVCFHIGSLTQDPKDFEGAIKLSRSVFDAAKSMDMKLTVLDIGGGFPVAKMAVSVNRAIDEYFPENGHYTIIAEPGRYVVTSAFTLLRQYHREKRKTNKRRNGQARSSTPVASGASRDPVDLITEKCKLPDLKVGDWLTMDDMGAYTTVCASTFNGFEKHKSNISCPVNNVKYADQIETEHSIESVVQGPFIFTVMSHEYD